MYEKVETVMTVLTEASSCVNCDALVGGSEIKIEVSPHTERF